MTPIHYELTGGGNSTKF